LCEQRGHGAILPAHHSIKSIQLRAKRPWTTGFQNRPDSGVKNNMWDIISWILILVMLAGLIVGGAWYYKTQMGGSDSSSGLFGAKAQKRLEVIEHSSVDNRRKLVLIRRDDVEHLIMTGGPVDVVIETGIGKNGRQLPQHAAGDPAAQDSSAARTPRRFGQAV
jgi:hypothetical protein